VGVKKQVRKVEKEQRHNRKAYRHTSCGLNNIITIIICRQGTSELLISDLCRRGVSLPKKEVRIRIILCSKIAICDLPVKIVPDMTYNVFGGTLNLAQSITVSAHVPRRSLQSSRIL